MDRPERYSRQAMLFDPRIAKSVTIIGAGHVGCMVANVLTNMGVGEDCEIHVWDGDEIEEGNLNATLYGDKHVGRPKVEVLGEIIKESTGLDIIQHPELYRAQDIETEMVILAVDSLRERDRIWRVIQERAPNLTHIIDIRTGRNTLIFYPFAIEDAHKKFEPSLSKDPVPLMCSEKSVAYNSSAAGGIAGALYRAICLGEEYPDRFLFDLGALYMTRSD